MEREPLLPFAGDYTEFVSRVGFVPDPESPGRSSKGMCDGVAARQHLTSSQRATLVTSCARAGDQRCFACGSILALAMTAGRRRAAIPTWVNRVGVAEQSLI